MKILKKILTKETIKIGWLKGLGILQGALSLSKSIESLRCLK